MRVHFEDLALKGKVAFIIPSLGNRSKLLPVFTIKIQLQTFGEKNDDRRVCAWPD